MKHEIDMKNYMVRTDLVSELIESTPETKVDDISISYIDLTKNQIEGKKKGKYITITFNDITDYNNKIKVKNVFFKELKKLIKKDSCLVVGLGNTNSTPDSLGPLTINDILVTNHLFEYGDVEKGFRRVWALSPGVMGQTGIETTNLIKSVVNSIKPDMVIVVDSLATSSVERLNKTIQMTDAGINPGSGIGNKRKEISKETLGVDVIAIGVPTVVDAATLVTDSINNIYKHFAYTKENYDKPSNKLVGLVTKQGNNLEKKDKENLLGLIGTLDNENLNKLLLEILSPLGFNLMVTPKEEDFIIDNLSYIISKGINEALHDKVN